MIKELQENPEFQKCMATHLFVSSEDVDKFKRTNSQEIKTKVGTYQYGNEFADLFKNEDYVNNILEIFNSNKTDEVKLSQIAFGDTSSIIKYPKSVFVKIADKLLENGALKGTLNIKLILKKLHNATDVSLLKNSKQQYSFDINGKKGMMSVGLIINAIELANKKFDFNQEIDFYGLNNEEFGFLIKNFALDYRLLTSYILSPESENFVKGIISNEIVNTSHINRLNKTEDIFLDKVVLNDELVDYVYKNMPKNYSLIEKAVYVYIKLCQTLTYDPEFYALDQRGEIAKIHEDINRLTTISPTFSKIVCYEFTEIYGKFLNMLGINYEVYSRGSNNVYGGSHTNLTFKAENFIIDADSVVSIISGDLYRAKVNGKIIGLECANQNSKAKQDFAKIVDKVYNDIKNEKNNVYSAEDVSSFAKWLNILNSLVDDEVKLGFSYKFNLLQKQAEKTNLPVMDRIAHIYKTTMCLFKNEIEKETLKPIIVRKKVNSLNQTLPVIIFYYYEKEKDRRTLKYKIFDYDGKVKDISRQELREAFKENIFGYIKTENKYIVVGLDEEEEPHVK